MEMHFQSPLGNCGRLLYCQLEIYAILGLYLDQKEERGLVFWNSVSELCRNCVQQNLKLIEDLALDFCKPESLNSSDGKTRYSWYSPVSVSQRAPQLYAGETGVVMNLLSSYFDLWSPSEWFTVGGTSGFGWFFPHPVVQKDVKILWSVQKCECLRSAQKWNHF